MEANKIV